MARQLRGHDRFLRGKTVRLIAPDNEQLGLVRFEDAVQKATEYGLDLVEVAGNATPPVCRIMDYGKHQYQQSKRQRDARKHQHHSRVKEIKFHPNIDDHDYQTKVNHAVAFLEKGDKVRVSMYFRGREMAHIDLGQGLMDRVMKDIGPVAQLDGPVQRSGRLMVMMLSARQRKP
ncbi:MAG: translation initiation factor IF-3 [Lentisphaeria bacterium]|nr:translation initiation factor IF-3 [Lentisphaeria bacterium]